MSLSHPAASPLWLNTLVLLLLGAEVGQGVWGTVERAYDPKKLFLLIGLVVWALAPATVFAKRAMATLPGMDSLPDRPPEYPVSDRLYRESFASFDEGIFLSYRTRWGLPETQAAYDPQAVANPSVESERQQLADRIVRQRIDTVIRGLLYSPQRAIEIQQAQKKIEELRNYSIPVISQGATGESPSGWLGEFRVGYDVISDFSKIEYVAPNLEAGLYHPEVVSTLLRRASAHSRFSLRLRDQKRRLSANVRFQWDLNRTLDTGVSHSLSAHIQATLGISQSLLGGDASRNYSMSLSFDL